MENIINYNSIPNEMLYNIIKNFVKKGAENNINLIHFLKDVDYGSIEMDISDDDKFRLQLDNGLPYKIKTEEFKVIYNTILDYLDKKYNVLNRAKELYCEDDFFMDKHLINDKLDKISLEIELSIGISLMNLIKGCYGDDKYIRHVPIHLIRLIVKNLVELYIK